MYYLLDNPLDAQEVESKRKEIRELHIMGMFSQKDVEESLASIQDQVTLYNLYRKFESNQ